MFEKLASRLDDSVVIATHYLCDLRCGAMSSTQLRWALRTRLRPEPPRQLTLEPAGATRVDTSRRGTPSVQRAMGCDTQSRSACTRQGRLRLRQRTHYLNRLITSPNSKTDPTGRLRLTQAGGSTSGFCSRRAARQYETFAEIRASR